MNAINHGLGQRVVIHNIPRNHLIRRQGVVRALRGTINSHSPTYIVWLQGADYIIISVLAPVIHPNIQIKYRVKFIKYSPKCIVNGPGNAIQRPMGSIIPCSVVSLTPWWRVGLGFTSCIHLYIYLVRLRSRCTPLLGKE